MDIAIQMILEQLADSINRLADVLENKKIKDDVALLFEKDYKINLTLQSLVNLLIEKNIISEENFKKYIQEARKQIRDN
jgi:hypothetical protein